MIIDSAFWVEVSCAVADAIRCNEKAMVISGRSDTVGTYGEPEIYTEWGLPTKSGRHVPVLRESRYPAWVDGEPDRKPCEHWVPTRRAGFA